MASDMQKLVFPSEKEFFAWKEEEEGATFTHYIKTTEGHQLAATNKHTSTQEVKSEACSSTGQETPLGYAFKQHTF